MPSAEAAHSARDGAAVSAHAASLDEERREVFDSVLQAMRIPEPDADRRAACAYLLRHLARTEQCTEPTEPALPAPRAKVEVS